MKTSRVAILLLFFSLPLFHCRWLKPTDNISSPHFFLLIHDEFCFLADIRTLSWFRTLPVFGWLVACLLEKKKKKCLYEDFWKVTNCDVVGVGENVWFVSTGLELLGIYVVWCVTLIRRTECKLFWSVLSICSFVLPLTCII